MIDNTALLRSLLDSRRIALEPGRLLTKSPPPRSGEQLADRVAGMLLGLAIGDALGRSSEGMRPADRAALHGEIRDYLPERHAAGQRFGLPSDDTQLAFWTLHRLIEDDGLDPEALAHEFCAHRIFGMGWTVRGFTLRFGLERLPWQEAGLPSAGNGALMRIAPVLVPHLRAPTPALWADAALAGMITHNDPASNACCVAFIAMLWELLGRSSAPPRAWWLDVFCEHASELEGETRYLSRSPAVSYEGPVSQFTRAQVAGALDRGASTRESCDTWYSGAFLLETVPSVIHVLCNHGGDPEEAIVRAVNDTWDNDTIAAIVGAAVGALHGRSALPSRWIDGLSGRVHESDDGTVFALIDAALERWGP